MYENNTLSALIRDQFPSIFREEGEDLVIFVENYYKFLESGYLNKAFSLRAYTDIDETLDAYVNYITNEFMQSIPTNIAADRKLLQKHILDLYRSKGSETSLRLLFRILYNEDIEVYLPEKDLLKPSHGRWDIPRYIEINVKSTNYLLDGQEITGVNSAATATVARYMEKVIEGVKHHLLYVENVNGTFEIGELLRASVLTTQDQEPYILGSAESFSIVSSNPEFSLGEILKPSGEDIHDEIFTARVSSITNDANSVVIPELTYGGNGYTLNSEFTIVNNTNVSGSGFALQVGGLSDVTTLVINSTDLSDFANTELDANTYGMTNADANVDTIIADAIPFSEVEVGSIDYLIVTNPGSNYDGSVTVTVTEPLLDGYNILDSVSGNYWGNNATITGDAAYGNGAISSVLLNQSGLGYVNNQIVSVQSTSNNLLRATLRVNAGPIGREVGKYLDDNGQLSSQKYLRDSYYWQEFSYEIRSSKTLERYVGILKKLAHPVGNEVFGRYLFTA